NVLVGLGIGVVLGVVIGWLLALRSKNAATESSTPATAINPLQSLVDELRPQLAAREASLTQAHSDLASVRSALAASSATQQATEKAACQHAIEHEKFLAAAREAQNAAEKELASIRTELGQEK